MRFQNSVEDGCPICGKETTLAAIEPHPTHPERSSIHTDVGFPGRSKLRRIGDVMQSCRERLSSRQRRIARRQPRRLVRMVRKEGFHATTLPDLHLEL